jgi:thioredoxin 1
LTNSTIEVKPYKSKIVTIPNGKGWIDMGGARFVPLSMMAACFGGTVATHDNQRIWKFGDTQVTLQVDANTADINGHQTSISHKIFVVTSETYAPIDLLNKVGFQTSSTSAGVCAFLPGQTGWLLITNSGSSVEFPQLLRPSTALAKNSGLSDVVTVTAQSFVDDVINSDLPVMVDFWANSCGPCKEFAPTVDGMAVEFAGKLKVCRLNVDDAPSIAKRYGISAIPTVLIFKDGSIIDTIVGGVPRQLLEQKIQSHID